MWVILLSRLCKLCGSHHCRGCILFALFNFWMTISKSLKVLVCQKLSKSDIWWRKIYQKRIYFVWKSKKSYKFLKKDSFYLVYIMKIIHMLIACHWHMMAKTRLKLENLCTTVQLFAIICQHLYKFTQIYPTMFGKKLVKYEMLWLT